MDRNTEICPVTADTKRILFPCNFHPIRSVQVVGLDVKTGSCVRLMQSARDKLVAVIVMWSVGGGGLIAAERRDIG